MTAITDKANLEFRDMESPGSTVPNEPEKPGIRQLFSIIDIALSSLGVNGAITVKKATLALLNADLAHAADTLAVVYNDATAANNGIYAKAGGSGVGSWSLTALALPASFSADLAEVLTAVEGVDAAVAAAEDAATTSQGYATDAAEALDAAQVALACLGIDQFFDTKALANAGTIANGDLILVWADESQGGARTFYVKEAGVLVFKAQVGAPSRFNGAAGNVFYGSLAANLNNTTAGTKDGDINTGFGLNVMPVATSAYACAAFGYSALFSLTTGHSNTGIGYQSGNALTTGIMNTLVGVDAGFRGTDLNYCTVVGHHCLNLAAFSGDGAVIIGQQTARYLTGGDYVNVIGRNAMANAPATGSENCEVIGGAAAIAASVNASTIIGYAAVSVAGAVSDSVIIGKFAQYGGGTISSNAIVGVDSFFRGTGGGGNNNCALGYQTGYSVSGTNNVFLGYRAGYQGSNASVSGSVVIGPLAGFDDLASNELVIANTDGAANVLIRGNFTTGDVTIRNDLTIGGDTLKVTTARTPASATATGTAGEVCWDSSYVYVCVATNTWKRSPLTTW